VCMCVCICIYVYIHVYTSIYMNIYILRHIYMNINRCIYIYICMHVWIYTCVHSHVDTNFVGRSCYVFGELGSTFFLFAACYARISHLGVQIGLSFLFSSFQDWSMLCHSLSLLRCLSRCWKHENSFSSLAFDRPFSIDSLSHAFAWMCACSLAVALSRAWFFLKHDLSLIQTNPISLSLLFSPGLACSLSLPPSCTLSLWLLLIEVAFITP